MIFYSSWIFFRGAWRALRARTLDMMVLVAVAIGTGWLYSVAATFWIEGEVFYEAAAFLAAFVLLGHWFEMRARGGANDAIRALLDLAPPMARRAARRRASRGADRRGARSATCSLIRPGREGAGRRRGRSRARASVDESMVTGESMPVAKGPATQLIGATINQQRHAARPRDRGRLRHRARADRASSCRRRRTRRRPAQRLADRAAFWLVLVALVGGLGTFLVWYVVVGRAGRRRRCSSRSRSS